MLFIFIYILCTIRSHAENYALIVGEAENLDKKNGKLLNDMQSEFGMFATLVGNPNWNVTLLNRQDTQFSKKFTKEEFQKQIDDIKNRLNCKSDCEKKGIKPIHKNDQLLIYIGTHGDMQQDEKTHSVQTLNGNLNLDILSEVVNLASENGVKLSIVDQSCYSGHLLNLNSNSACLITSSTSHNFGYMNRSAKFSFELMNTIRKNKILTSLEDVFLTSRLGSIAPSQPMINTYAGLMTSDFMRHLESFFGRFRTFDVDRDAKYCQESDQFKNDTSLLLTALKSQINDKKLLKNISDLYKKIVSLNSKYFSDLENYRLLSKNKQYICVYKENVNAKNEILSSCDLLKSFTNKIENGKSELCYRRYFINSSDIIENNKSHCEELNIDFIIQLENVMKNLDNSDRILDLNNSDSDDLKRQLRFRKRILYTKKNQADDKIFEAAKIEAEIYSKLYDHFSKQAKKAKIDNPCANFILN